MVTMTVEKLVEEAKKSVVEIDVHKTQSTLAEKNVLLVDVREPEEYSKGHIKNAMNIPRGVLEFRISPSYPDLVPELTDKTTEMILYCRSGARSALAAQTLGLLGYQSVASMSGGFLAWEGAQLHIEVS